MMHATLPDNRSIPVHEALDCADSTLPESGANLIERLNIVFGEIFSAVNDALHDTADCADARIKRASHLLKMDPLLRRLVTASVTESGTSLAPVRGGLSPYRIRQLTAHIEARLDTTLRTQELAALVRLSPSHFCRAFKDSFGDSPHNYVLRRRVERARQLMLNTDFSLGQIAIDCGLADQPHFNNMFRRFVGESPGAWRRARSQYRGSPPGAARESLTVPSA